MKINRYWVKPKRHNRTYRGTLTTYQKKQNLRIVIAIFASITFGMLIELASTTNSMEINGGAVKVSTPRTSPFVDPERSESVYTDSAEPAGVVREITRYNAGDPAEIEIRKIAKEMNFKWVDYLVRLAMCESSLNSEAINDNGNYGIDRGLFQINNKYHWEISDECAFDIDCSTRWTIGRINDGYQHEWMCDKKI